MMEAKQKRLLLMLNGALVIYESISEELLPLLYKPENRHLLTSFDLIGSALHWMQRTICDTLCDCRFAAIIYGRKISKISSFVIRFVINDPQKQKEVPVMQEPLCKKCKTSLFANKKPVISDWFHGADTRI